MVKSADIDDDEGAGEVDWTEDDTRKRPCGDAGKDGEKVEAGCGVYRKAERRRSDERGRRICKENGEVWGGEWLRRLLVCLLRGEREVERTRGRVLGLLMIFLRRRLGCEKPARD